MSNGKELQKNIIFSVCYCYGTVIGSGVFFKISNVTEVTGQKQVMALFVWSQVTLLRFVRG